MQLAGLPNGGAGKTERKLKAKNCSWPARGKDARRGNPSTIFAEEITSEGDEER